MATTTTTQMVVSTPIPNLAPVPNWETHLENARNWSQFRKLYTMCIVSSIGFVSTFATSIYAPGHDDVAHEFSVSLTSALLPLSFYALGMGFGPMIASPMSETLGRKAVYLTTVPLFAIFILGSGFSTNIHSLCACRFFAGLFGAPGVSIASATIADITPPDKRGMPLAIYYSIPFLGSLLGPMVGGVVVEWRGWRWTQWTTLFIAAAVFPLVGFIHESYRGVLVQRIAKRESGGRHNHVQRDTKAVLKQFFTTTTSRPVHMLFTEPIVGFVCMYCSFQFALLYTFIVGTPYVFTTTYNFSVGQQSLSFFGLVVGAICATAALVAMDHLIYQPKYLRFRQTSPNLEFPPEHRLYPSMIGSLIIPIGLFAFAWTARPDVHWAVPIIAQGCAMLGSMLTYVSANMYMVDTYGPMYGASAAGANSLVRYVLTATFPLFTLQMYHRLGIGWTASLLGFCTVAMTPIPWVFWIWGARLRGRSRYEKEM
jgi:DHA1 family multidrug resistance protein-like MFS transporter